MKRSKHNLSHYHLTSFDMGEVVPIGCLEVLPGDSFQHSTSMLLRVTPQLKPVMHPVICHVQHYYVPNRLLWSGWEDFITGDSATPPPTIAGAAHSEGSLVDYLGVYGDPSNEVLALPIRAYNLIWNTYFRDQDLQSEVAEDQTSVLRCAWGRDYFTTARPWAQKGDTVTLPIGTSAPVKSSTGVSSAYIGNGSDASSQLKAVGSGGSPVYGDVYADLAAATGMDVISFREAFAQQRYQEARARYGSDYVDYLRYLGIRPSDGRLQRPEYLGGGRQVVQFSEVLATAEGSGTSVGDLAGHGIAALRSNRYRRFFEEHGWLISVCFVRPIPVYGQAHPRSFSRTTKEDYYQRELESVGAQEVLNKEVYAAHSSPDGVFGYSERYAEYRSVQNRVSSEFRSSKSYDWHFARLFASDPALNSSFIECNPTKRVFAEQANDSLWCMARHSIQARRLVRNRAIGRIA